MNLWKGSCSNSIMSGRSKMNKLNKVLLFLFTISLCLFCFSCGSEKDSPIGSSGENNIVEDVGRKIIYNANYSFTMKDTLKNIQELSSKLNELDGYIDSSNYSFNDDESFAYATIVYRVPTEHFEEFLAYIDSFGGKNSKSIESKDVTSTYSEIEERLKTLYSSKKAYQNILENENLSINEVITINDKIDNIDTEINVLEREKASYDNLINYSTITVHITEYRNNAFFASYGDYLANFFIAIGKGILYILPVAFIGGIISFVVLLVERFKRKNRQK